MMGTKRGFYRLLAGLLTFMMCAQSFIPAYAQESVSLSEETSYDLSDDASEDLTEDYGAFPDMYADGYTGSDSDEGSSYLTDDDSEPEYGDVSAEIENYIDTAADPDDIILDDIDLIETEDESDKSEAGSFSGLGNPVASGDDIGKTAEDQVSWAITGETGNYTLTISGTGDMKQISSDNPPWKDYKSGIKTLVIEPGVTSIGSYTCYYMSNLTTVTFASGSTVETIGDQAFRYCEKISTISFPAGLKSIGVRSFEGCKAIPSVTLPSTFTTLGSYAFYNCSGIYSVSFPADLEVIGDYAFYGCSALATVTFDNASILTKIGTCSFQNCKVLTVIDFPSSLAEINEYAFSGCSSLSTVTFGEESSLKVISGHAFQTCKALTVISFPEGLTTIGEYAFENCDLLTGVEFPTSLKYLKNRAFQYCDVLKTIKFNGTTLDVNRDNDSYVFFDCPKVDTVTLPSALTTIPKGWFEKCALESITIPATVTSMGESAFNNNTKLDNLVLPAGLTYIGTNCFRYDAALSNLTIPDTVTFIGNNAFEGCKKFTSFTANGLKDAGSEMLLNCTGLVSCVLPAITKVPSGMLKNCTALESFDIPNTATEIAANAFNGCSLLADVSFDETSKVKYIYSSAFKGCTALTSIDIPKSVLSIEQNAFEGCTGLAAVNIEEGNTVYYSNDDGAVFKQSNKSLYIVPPAYEGELHPEEGATNLTALYYKGNTTITSITIPSTVTTIDERALEGCTSLETVIFAEGSQLTTIKPYAFYNCTSLKNIILPIGVTAIGESAFENCTSLESINIPLGVTSLSRHLFKGCIVLSTVSISEESEMTWFGGDYVFENCAALETVTIPDNVTTINHHVFYKCNGLKRIVIPEGVTKIDYNAFEKCTALESVSMPTSLTRIESNAFYGCSALATAVLNEGLTYIGNYAFRNCSELKNATIPSTVTKVDYGAFMDCAKLANLQFALNDDGDSSLTNISGEAFKNAAITEVTIPASVTSMESNIFSYCASLANIFVDENNATYKNGTGSDGKPDGIVYKKSDSSLYIKPMASTAEISLPDGITELTSDYYKGNTGIKKVTIPASVKTIGSDAFRGCTALETVEFANGSQLTKISSNAFNGCSSLKTISLPGTLTNIESYAFQECTSLSSITIPASVKSIAYYAFYKCSNLSQVTFGKNSVLESIDRYVFGSTALTSITLPKSLTNLNSEAFGSGSAVCANLATITIESGNTVYYSDSGIVFLKSTDEKYIVPPKNTHESEFKTSYTSEDVAKLSAKATSVTIPKNVTEIADGAFRNNAKIKTVKFAKGSKLKTIGSSAFYGSAITSISLPSGTVTIGNYAFYNCDGLKSFKIPVTVKSIGNQAFYDCDKLGSITIPGKVTHIGSDAFYSCDSLKTATINCASTGESMFQSCKALTTAKTGGTTTAIADYTFYYCSALSKVTLGSKVNSLGRYAFSACTKLKSLKLPASLKSAGSYAFSGCTSLGSINIPSGLTVISSEMFSGCTGLKKITVPKGVTTIAASAFKGSGLTAVSLPVTVTSIGSSAYEGCKGLKSVNLPSGLTTIPDRLFYDCTGLASVTVPGTITTMGSYVFSGCSNLKKAVLPGSLETVPSYTFRNCAKLTDVTLSEGITTLPGNIFQNCNSLKVVNIPASVTSIELGYSGAFANTPALEEINVDEDNDTYLSVDGILYKRTASGIEYLYCPTSWNSSDTLTPPEGLTSIPANAYQGNSTIVNLVIPASVTSIGILAFSSCENLRTVVFEEGCRITEIPSSAFSHCPDLNSVYFKGETAVTSIGASAFRECKDLTEIRFENNTCDVEIGDYCFYKDYAFEGVFIDSEPAALGDIGYGAFYYCESVTDLHIGESCSSIGTERYSDSDADEFGGCRNLRSFTVDEGNEHFSSVDGVLFASSYSDGQWNRDGLTLFKYPLAKPAGDYTIPDGVVAIADYAFSNCRNVLDVDGTESLQAVGYRAFYNSTMTAFDFASLGNDFTFLDNSSFYNCDGLTEADLSNTRIVSVGRYAFDGSNYIKTIILPVGLTSIGQYAFYGCSALQDLNIDDTVSSIGQYAFYNCYNWLNARVPASLEGTIGQYTYYYCSKLGRDGENYTEVVIPDGVTYIGSHAFYDCYGIQKLTIGSNVETISDYAFYYCSQLTDLRFADNSSLKSIGLRGFGSCSRLETVALPEGLTDLGVAVFYYCSALKRVDLPSTLTKFVTYDADEYVSSNNSKTYGSYLFRSCNKLKQVIMRNNVLPKSGTSVYLPRMFYGAATNSNKVYIYGGRYVDPDAEDKVDTDVYTFCGSDENLVFVDINDLDDPDKDPVINGSGGSGTVDPISYDKSGTIKGAADQDISWVYDDTTYTLTISGTGAMADSTTSGYSLVNGVLVMNLGTQNAPWKNFSAVTKKIIIGDGITRIGDCCFYSMSAAESIEIPSTVTEIGRYAFYYCSSVTSIDLPAGLVSIEDYTFCGCRNLANPEIPDSVRYIGESAFSSCDSITEIDIPGSVQSIGYEAFYNCSGLVDITLNEGLKTIGTSAFYGTSLTSLALPSTLTHIEETALKTRSGVGKEIVNVTLAEGNADYLMEDGILYCITGGGKTYVWGNFIVEMDIDSTPTPVIFIPASYTEFDHWTFNKNYDNAYHDKAYIYVDEENESFKTNESHTALYSADGRELYMVAHAYEGEFTVEDGTKVIHRYAMYNRDKLTAVTMPDSVTTIGYGAFYECDRLESVDMGESVSAIDDYAFYYCTKLKDINIPATLTSIGYEAFYNCSYLGSISLPEGLKTIGAFCFDNCDRMLSLSIPGSLETISNYAFYGCDGLRDVRLGEGIKTIGTNAFGYCNSIEKIILPDGLEKINDNAFSNCVYLTEIWIPASVNEIYYLMSTNYQGAPFPNSPFEYSGDFDNNSNLVIHGASGSYAETYFAAHELKYTSSPGYYRRYKAKFIADEMPKSYITYVLDADAGETNDIGNPVSFRKDSAVIELKPAYKAASAEAPYGYTFDAWYTDAAHTKRIERIIPSVDTGNYTLYPEWTVNHGVKVTVEGGIDIELVVPDGSTLASAGFVQPEMVGSRLIELVYEADPDKAFGIYEPVKEDLILEAVFAGDDEDAVTAPTATVASGIVPAGVSVGLVSQSFDSVIWYTIDGTSPVSGDAVSEDALQYTDSIILTEDVFEADSVTLTAVAVKGDLISKKAVYTYTLMDEDSNWGEILPVDRYDYADAEKTPAGLWIAGLEESYTFTGSAIKPSIRVYDDKKLLVQGTDYTLSYKNNVNATTPKTPAKKQPVITVTGKGDYRNSISANFAIDAVTISNAEAVAKCYDVDEEYVLATAYSYELDEQLFDRLAAGKKAQKPIPEIVINNKKLKNKKDFALKYYRALFGDDADAHAVTKDDIVMPWGVLAAKSDFKSPGMYYVVAQGKGNYKDRLMLRYEIVKSATPISKAKITGLAKSYDYTGAPITPGTLKIKIGKKELVEDKDYGLVFTNNTNAGKATLTIYGTGAYVGTVKKTFTIKGLPMKKAKVNGFKAAFDYTGRNIIQTGVSLTYPVKTKTGTQYVELQRGSDYNVTYKNNINKGKAVVIYTGTGNMTGSVKKTFKINGLNILKASTAKRGPVTIEFAEGTDDIPYVKGGTKPAMIVSYKGRVLAAGKEYTVKYKNFSKKADAETAGKNAPVAIVTGKGNFAGSVNCPYSIVESDLAGLTITAADIVYAVKKGNAAKVTIKDKDGKALLAGTDYDKSFVYTYAEPGYTVDASGNIDNAKTAGSELDIANEIPAAGSVLRVKVSAKAGGNYTGETSAVYRIAKADISKAKITIKRGTTFVYSGTGIVPRKENLIVKVGGKELKATDYEIVSCTNNIRKGKAVITLRGAGPAYGGIKTQAFTIGAKSMK